MTRNALLSAAKTRRPQRHIFSCIRDFRKKINLQQALLSAFSNVISLSFRMIKRQFYSLEHRSRDDQASSGSSSSSSESEAVSSSDDEEALSVAQEEEEFPATGPESESSDDEKNLVGDNNHSLAPDEWESQNFNKVNDINKISTKKHGNKKQDGTKTSWSNQWADLVDETLKEKTVDFADECVITCKTVLKCRLCPKTICLTSETMQAHLDSKKHARALKQMKEGKLKVMLNSDGEEEEQGETHAERHARVVASFKSDVAKETSKRKKPSGRQRQRKRAKKKALNAKKSEALH